MMIYFDHNASTMMHPKALSLMQELSGQILNPSSIHTSGRRAKNLLENARLQVANLLGIGGKVGAGGSDYIVTFTASGTEANNLIMSNFRDADIFISAIEHLSIIGQAKYFPNIKFIKVDHNGIVDLQDLKKQLEASGASKKLVSIMFANNETGAIQPLKEIADIVHYYGGLLHSDCVQAVGKIEVNLRDLNVDFSTISAHKFGGPVGAGALIYSAKHHLLPAIIGGGQERGLRSGTENVAAIAAFGLAAEIAQGELGERQRAVKKLQALLEQSLPESAIIACKSENRLPNTSLVMMPGFDAQTALIAFDLRQVAVSSGAACSSGKVAPSHVLGAMGVAENDAKSAIRVSFSHYNTEEEVGIFINHFREIYHLES